MQAPELLSLYNSRKISRERSIKLDLLPLITHDYSMHNLFERSKILFSISLIYGKQMRWLIEESRRIVEMFYTDSAKRIRREQSGVHAGRPVSIADHELLLHHEDTMDNTVDNYDAGSIIDHDMVDGIDHDVDAAFPSEIEVGRGVRSETEIRNYEFRQPKYKRMQLAHPMALKDAFIIQSITAKLKAIEAHILSDIEVGRDDAVPEYDYEAVNVSDFVEDNSVVEYEKDEFVFGEVVSGKGREEQADIFYGLLVNLEKGNLSVEQDECYGEIRCKKMGIIV